MQRTRIVVTLVTSALLLMGSASADVLISNLPGTASGTGSNLGLGTDGADRTKAVGLTMGADALDFESVVAFIENGTPASTLSGGIYSDVGGNPGALLAAFTPVAVPIGQVPTETMITTAAPYTLAAGTSYWFVLDGPDFANDLLWASLSPNAAPTAMGDITFDGYRFSSNGGTSWGSSSIYNGVTINAIPEPTALSLLAVLGLLAARRR
jgi:hypothetical protein